MATGDKLVTLDGLKAVYDKVDGDVGSLKSAFEDIFNKDTVSEYVTSWGQGRIISTTGANQNSNYFCRSLGYLSFSNDTITITVDDTYKFYIVEFSGESASAFTQSFGDETDGLTGSYTLTNTAGKYYRIVLYRVDAAQFAPSTVSATAVQWAYSESVIKDQYLNGNKVLRVGEGLDYDEIQDAIDAADDYAVILVYPRATPYSRFSLMRKLDASYPWSGLSSVKHISIIGMDQTNCIVESDSGNYDTPPAEIATNGTIKNLTFIATHTASDGTETTGSFAVHVDNRPADENGMNLLFEDCTFVSYQTAAVGLGLYKNQNITFEKCVFKSITDATWKPNENYDNTYMCSIGSFFMHTSMGLANGNMFVNLRDCMFLHSGGQYSVRIMDEDTTKTALLEAINNTLWCADTQSTGVYPTAASKTIMKQPYNHGNNATEWNA